MAVLGRDFHGLRPTMDVQEGDPVKLGQALFHDKRHPEIRYTAPGSGVVKAIHRGGRRVLLGVEIQLQGDEEITFARYERTRLPTLERDEVRENLQRSGLWTALRTRPFSRVPTPRAKPHALFVTAVDSNPLAAEPSVVIGAAPQDFMDGLMVLSKLTDGKVFVCKAPDQSFSVGNSPVTVAEFSGPHPAGLPGTHMHFLSPVSHKRVAWHIGYQDVMAVGRLFTTGRLPVARVISLAGPTVLKPRLVRTRLGASVGDLVRDQLRPVEARALSGSVLAGRQATGPLGFLGRYHTQVTILDEGGKREFLGWMAPGLEKFSVLNLFASALFRGRRLFPLTTSQNGSPRALVPIGAYERVMPLDILAGPLLRSLLVRDTETAQGLGALELDEEDLALCSFVCPSKHDFGPLLRSTLDQIEREG